MNSNPLKIVIAISGQAGSGKTTYSKALAKTFGLRYVSSGLLFRKLANELGVSLEEFHKIAEKEPKYDLMVDQRAIDEAERGGVVIEGHLAAWILKDLADIKIFFKAPLETRAKRIAERDGISYENALRDILFREESNRKRGLKLYNIDITDWSIFDLIIDTGNLPVNSIINIVTNYVTQYILVHYF
ncbi:MAG: cytidylate kinase [Thermoprotei archaeon]|nr:MAG: cytidylate kinase [Thermoprotei archaeon]